MTAMLLFIALLVVAILVFFINNLIPYVNFLLIGSLDIAFNLGEQVPILGTFEAGLSNLFFTLGISLIVLLFVKKGFETYILWTDGDADSDPIYLLALLFKAIGSACGFKGLYDYFIDIVKELIIDINSSITGYGGGELFKKFTDFEVEFNPIGLILMIVWIIMFFIVFSQIIKMGIELTILKIGFPLACTGLINADKGIFKAYFMTLVKSILTIVVQVTMLRLAAGLAQDWSVGAETDVGAALLGQIASIVCMVMALGSPKLLSEFLIPSGQGLSMTSVYHTSQMAGNIARTFSKAA